MDPTPAVNNMLTAVSSGLTTVIGWMGTVVSSLVGDSAALGELLPLLAISVSISVLMLGFKVIRSVIWGA